MRPLAFAGAPLGVDSPEAEAFFGRINLVAWPVAYFAARGWLQNFAYRVDLAWWVFAAAGAASLLIALATVTTQVLRAALAHPIQALRNE